MTLVLRLLVTYNWGEPERAPHKRYSYICANCIYIYYGTSVTRNICPAWLYGHKREIFYCAFSCPGYGPYIRCSNLVNCKFTLVPACIDQLATIGIKLYRTAPGSKGGESETELVVSSTTQGLAKNAIKIDVLLTDSDNTERQLKLKFLLTVGRHYVEGTIMQLYRPTRHYETVCHCLLGYVSVVFIIYLLCYSFVKVF